MKGRATLIALASAAMVCAWAGGQVATTRLAPSSSPTSAPATTTSAPAEEVDPVAMDILQRLEAAGPRYANITADLYYREDLIQEADVEQRTGKVYYQAKTDQAPPRYRIHFDRLRQGDGPNRKVVEDYFFDGRWFTWRKEAVKLQEAWELARPGETLSALELGQGRFPLPFGQKTESVLKYFRVSTRPAEESDPPGCDYLRLDIRQEHKRDLPVVRIEMWVQRETALPIKMVSLDASEHIKTAVFSNIATPAGLPWGTFDLPEPGRGWEVRVWSYEELQRRR